MNTRNDKSTWPPQNTKKLWESLTSFMISTKTLKFFGSAKDQWKKFLIKAHMAMSQLRQIQWFGGLKQWWTEIFLLKW